MFKKKIYQHLHQDKEYVDLFSQAQKHSDNPMEQIEYVRKQNVSKKHELMFLIEMSQMYFAITQPFPNLSPLNLQQSKIR